MCIDQNGAITPNIDAYYEAETINLLLRLKLDTSVDIDRLGAIDYSEENQSISSEHINAFLDSKAKPYKGSILLPIWIRSHWVGVKITDKGSSIEVSYYDSATSDTFEKSIRPAVEQALFPIYEKPITWENKTRFKQEDAASCGAYLVENIYKDIRNPISRRVTAESLRNEHIDLIREKDHRYYDLQLKLAEDKNEQPHKFARK